MSLGFRWIAWSAYTILPVSFRVILFPNQVNMIVGGVMTIAVYFLLVETRGSKILDDRAQRLTAQTGIPHIADTDGSTQPQTNMLELIKTTASRPIVFLITEPVVTAIATWAALLLAEM